MKKCTLISFVLTMSFFLAPILYCDLNKTAEEVNSTEQELVYFNPPKGWFQAEPDKSTRTVKLIIVGKPKTTFAPTIKLSTQLYPKSLKDYLNMIKAKNQSEGIDWKDLGMIQTKAGKASLSQNDEKTEYGTLRFMRVILLNEQRIYILTATALASEFSFYYKEFFDALTSLTIIKDFYQPLSSKEKQQLKQEISVIQNEWQKLLKQSLDESKEAEKNQDDLNETRLNLFNNKDFQEHLWLPFKSSLEKNYQQPPEWQSFTLMKVKNDLFNLKQ